jgi:hypothetical protein
VPRAPRNSLLTTSCGLSNFIASYSAESSLIKKVKREVEGVEYESDGDYRVHLDELEDYCDQIGRVVQTAEVQAYNRKSFFAASNSHSLAPSLKAQLQRRTTNTRLSKLQAPALSEEHKRRYDRIYHSFDGAAEAHVSIDENDASDNDTESVYLNLFLNGLSDTLADYTQIVLLGSSTTDLLTRMRNRTYHCNIKTLIE